MARFLTLNGLAARVGRSWYGAEPASDSPATTDFSTATANFSTTSHAVAATPYLAGRLKLGRLSAALFLAGAMLFGAASDAGATEKMLQGSMIVPEGTAGFGTGVNEGNTNMVAMIRERGVVNIGVKSDIKGLGYLDEATGQFSGLEVELGKRIAKALGVDVHFVAVNSGTRTELLDQGVLDLVMGTMTITPTRQMQWDFSTPYFSDYASVLVENPEIKSLPDLVGKSIAVTVKTNSALALTQELVKLGAIDLDSFDPETFVAKTWSEGISFKEYDNAELAHEALKRGVVAGFCNDRSQLSIFLNDERHMLPETFAPQPFGIATPKDSDLSEFVAKVVVELTCSGELARINDGLGLPQQQQLLEHCK